MQKTTKFSDKMTMGETICRPQSCHECQQDISGGAQERESLGTHDFGTEPCIKPLSLSTVSWERNLPPSTFWKGRFLP